MYQFEISNDDNEEFMKGPKDYLKKIVVDMSFDEAEWLFIIQSK